MALGESHHVPRQSLASKSRTDPNSCGDDPKRSRRQGARGSTDLVELSEVQSTIAVGPCAPIGFASHGHPAN